MKKDDSIQDAEAPMVPPATVLTSTGGNLVPFFYYFAYGSNLLTDRMRYRQKGAEYDRNGLLNGYELAFIDFSTRWQGALATIIDKNDGEVWGCIWRIPLEYAESLDKQETGYNRLNVTIKTSDGDVECRTYQYSDPMPVFNPPSPHYKLVIVEGAKEHELPEEYIKRLEKVPVNDYQGPVDVDIPLLETLNKVEKA
ncbi:unnamed protein product [Caenorhabditis auriculariae]|uniref:gamma-glutamylcyclotransferase n=1 Tax=Caenorhabditis auriculariae TaxID=2777116 RepID=A0A8S1H604_9PELO|nr:unnamed protein product [Caenorhabditis auriculariae]